MGSAPVKGWMWRALGAAVLAAASQSGTATAALNANCVVSVLNRSAYVKADGSWVLPNVPANIGRVRVRATCVENGITRSGQSPFLAVPRNGVIKVGDIPLDAPEPVPARLALTAPQPTLTAVGATLQLSAIATYPGGSTADVTQAAKGTNYTSSNPRIASVTEDGLVTAHASGVVIVTALSDGASGLLRISVVLGGDSDGDGISDDVELANGLNPNDPVDALEDYDHDGLTNLQELTLGTQIRNADSDGDNLPDGAEVATGTEPLVFDTDGDGLGDGLEVATGSNPLDPTSYNLALALNFIDVRPGAVTLVVNTLIGEASRQLQVTGHLIDGRTLDLTSRGRRTNYASSDLTVANFGATDGLVFAGSNGSATVTVDNSGHTALVPVSVRTFAPTALSSLSVPGYANNVDVAGDYVYVAAGNAGLQVVDVADRRNPRIVGSVDTPGVAIDVRVVGSLAYVADGVSGLQVIDVSNPLTPVTVGSLDTPGDAQDLVVRGTRVFIADGASGLQIVDVSAPAAPVLVGFVDTPGTARGVDVAGNLAVLADGPQAVRVVDISNPAAPVLRGAVNVPGDVKDLVARDRYAYVAAYTGSLQVVDFGTPSNPVVVGSAPGFVPRDFELSGRFGLAAEQLFVNAVPVVDTTNPASPIFQTTIGFPGDYAGTGIALDPAYVYMTGEYYVVYRDYGDTGNTRLFVGQYLEISDEAGVAPTVSFTSPQPDSQYIAGSTLTLRATATDDVRVASVTFSVDGVPATTDFTAPYEYTYTIPANATAVTFGATALDFGSNAGQTSVTIQVIPDPRPVVTLASPAEGAAIMEATTILLAATASDNVQVTQVRFLADGVVVGTAATPPYQASYFVPVGTTTLTVAAEATDNLGQVGSAARTLPVIPDPPPSVVLTSPSDGAQLVEGQPITLAATATDNTSVAQVVFIANGQALPPDTTPPYSRAYTVPLGLSSLTVEAAAVDNLGRMSSVSRTVTVVPDPLTTVVGRVLDTGSQPLAGASVSVFGQFTAQTEPDGTFTVASVPTARGDIVVRAEATVGGEVYSGLSQGVPPVASGVTNAGDIQLQAQRFETEIGDLIDPAEFNGLDDGYALVSLPFPFTFYGVPSNEVYVGTNGYLTFGSGDSTSYPDVWGFAIYQPRIAPLFRDWITDQDVNGAGIYVNTQLPGRVVVTWRRVRTGSGGEEAVAAVAQPAAPGEATFQVILYSDGRIRFGYDGVATRDGIVGITPGGELTPTLLVDFSLSSAFSVDSQTAPYEQFFGPYDGPFDLDHSFVTFVPAAGGGYQGQVDVPYAPPTVTIASPADGEAVIEGQDVQVAAEATDDVLVSSVEFTVDGTPLDSLVAPPFEVFYAVPLGATSLSVEVRATDNQGLTATASRTVPVLPDPPPTVAIANPPAGGALVEGETIALTASATDNVAVARVDFAVEGLTLAPDTLSPYVRSFRVPRGAGSLAVTATATDNLGRSASAGAAYSIEPDPLTTVQGTVVDSAGNPVAGATVGFEMHGVKAEFFDFDAPLAGLPDLAGRTPDATRLVSSVDFRNPGNLFNADTFDVGLAPYLAARFSGLIKVASNGSYRFTLGADDGARLLVRGAAVAEVVAAGQYTEASGVVSLTAGMHPIEIFYYQNDGYAELQLSVTAPGQERDTVGAAELFQSPDPFTAVTDAVGAFSVAGVPTALGAVRVSASATLAGEEFEGRSEETQPVRGGLTNLGTITLRPAATTVGYYDLSLNRGAAAQVAPITTAGMQAVDVGDLNTADLSAIGVLFAQNSDNGGYSSIYRANLTKVFDFVWAGGVLVFHDRHVDTVESVLPGAPGNIVRSFADPANINIVDGTTRVTNGPGGALTNTSLDGGNYSDHGYVAAATTPAGARGILSRSNPAELVLYAYPYGRGWIVYSTIPLDYYLGGSTAFRTIYAPNIVAFAKDLRNRRLGP